MSLVHGKNITFFHVTFVKSKILLFSLNYSVFLTVVRFLDRYGPTYLYLDRVRDLCSRVFRQGRYGRPRRSVEGPRHG